MRTGWSRSVFPGPAILLIAACAAPQDSVPARADDNASATSLPMPPTAMQRPYTVTSPHGHTREDPYYWLRERENPDVIAYLEAENAYTDEVMAHTEGLREELFEEIRGRIVETDETVPYRLGSYWYYTRTEEGKAYRIYARRRGSLDGPEEILLDANERAEGKEYYAVMGLQVSSGEDVLAFAEDTVGRRVSTVYFKDLNTGDLLQDVIPQVTGNMAWAEDNQTLFYARQDPNTLRSERVMRHRLGTDATEDALVYYEADETFRTSVSKTKSREYIVIGSSHTLSNEYRVVRATEPQGEPRLFIPRERGHEHDIDHANGHFYIRTNDDAPNFRLMRTPVDRTERRNWEEVVPRRDDVFLQDFELFTGHLVLAERRDGLTQLRVRPWEGTGEYDIAFDEPAYVASIGTNREFDTGVLRFTYESMTTPSSTYDYDMPSRGMELLKRDEVVGGYDPAEYGTERLFATARDGTRVPVSLVYRRALRRDGPQPLLLYGYGSYGSSTDPRFSSIRLSLLDRGFIYAIAHIRGGQEMGRDWYEQGKLRRKMNTFTDFVDVAEHLVEHDYTEPEQLYAMGGSAGGLLIGAVINMRPDLFDGAVAAVPFVDVVTTMLDETIPLTTFEWDEWGDPRKPGDYEYMLSYSPYDQVSAQPYPHLLVTSGLHDSQVQYWEPTKWVARLRERKTDDNRLLLRTNMQAGHGGASGRYESWRETAFEYAFLLELAGLAETVS